MSKLAGYRTLLVNVLIAAAAFSGLQIRPEIIQRHVDIALYGIAALNVFMRIVTKGPVGQLVPQLGIIGKFQASLSAVVAALPEISIMAVQPAADPPSQPAAPASTAAGQDDVVTLLPIYAVKVAQAVNQALSETNKAT